MKIPSIVDASWHHCLNPLFEDEKMRYIRDKVIPNTSFFPQGNSIFKVFKMPMESIKVVIMGQDPYPNNMATGLAFAVNSLSKVPKSLKIIEKEILGSSVSTDRIVINTPKWKTLDHWVDQGVFLLNSALTVESGNPGSHINIWRWFTAEVVRYVSTEMKPIWILWGKKAASYSDYIDRYVKYEERKTKVGMDYNYGLEGVHPAAEFYGNKYKFAGCNHFNQCNEILLSKGQSIINW